MVEISSLVKLSTAHITKQTADWLKNLDWTKEGPVGGPYSDFGWFMYAHDDTIDGPNSAPHAPEGEYPADLWDVFQKVNELGASHLILDCDADEIEGLPTYQW